MESCTLAALTGTVHRSVQLPIMEDAPKTSENVTEAEISKVVEPQLARAFDDQLAEFEDLTEAYESATRARESVGIRPAPTQSLVAHKHSTSVP